MNSLILSIVWMVLLVVVGWVTVFQLNAWRYRRFAEAILIQEAEERAALEYFREDAAKVAAEMQSVRFDEAGEIID